MFRPLPLYFALRYLRARSGNSFVSFINLSSIAGVTLGVAVLITVISVMNGFETELRSRILGVVSHISITGWDGKLEPARWQQVLGEVEEIDGVIATAPYVELEGLLANGGLAQGVLVRAVDPDMEMGVSRFDDYLMAADLSRLKPGAFGIFLGRDLALALNVTIGDRVTLLTPDRLITPVGVIPRSKRFRVIGIFSAGMYEYDSALALIHLRDGQQLARLNDGVSGIRVRVGDTLKAPGIARAYAMDNPEVAVSDWTRQNVNFFRAVQTEKVVMFIILALIVAVAAFNIVSALIMVVTEKQGDIAILRTLGLTPAGIAQVFIVQGSLIGLTGVIIGLCGGIALALNVETLVPAIERLVGIDVWPADVYYISELPSDLHLSDVVVICLVSFFMCVAATIYPAFRAARLLPAQVLRHE